MFGFLSPKPDTSANERAAYANDVADLNKRLSDRNMELIRVRAAKHTLGRALTEALKERDAARAALTEIAAMETAGSASIGRRMAARARQALPAKTGSAAVRAAMETA